MGTLVLRNELGSLETGLKDLKRSRLMGIQEYKDMYLAIEKHHRNLKLAHLTGQAKDLQVQAEQDTKFYQILLKMMNEVKLLRTGQQKDSLMKVFTWFKANKHTLHTGPHFGKSYQLKEASEVVKKAKGSTQQSSPKKSKVVTTEMAKEEEEKKPITRLESAEGMRRFFQSVTPSTQPNDPETPKNFFNFDLPSNKDYVNEYLTSRFFQAGEISGIGRPSTLETPSHRAYMNDQVPSDRTTAMERFINSPSLYDGPDLELQRLASSLGDLDDVPPELPSHHQEEEEHDSLDSQRYIESVTVDSRYQDEEDGFEVDESGPADIDMELPEMRRKLSREQTMSASFRAAVSAPTHEDQFSNLSTYIPKKMVHPIASLVNPHAQLAAMEARRAEEEYQASRENTGLSQRILSRSASAVPKSSSTPQTSTTYRPMTAVPSHPGSMNQWNTYTKDRSYGQEILRGNNLPPSLNLTAPPTGKNESAESRFVLMFDLATTYLH
ncbi:uncharacterized protein LOC133178928 [Saccostrea echinata]|uniref:uncharacterized protein LOC133178928 n=1 Tax=Saccostrea echinata TaxID=191078 RepID=UPI002A81C03D|nr:uncharacterized protein LOC133178928 [Saccostrea echinata]